MARPKARKKETAFRPNLETLVINAKETAAIYGLSPYGKGYMGMGEPLLKDWSIVVTNPRAARKEPTR